MATTVGERLNTKSVFGILAAVVALFVVLAMPTPNGMSPEAQRTAALFAFSIVLWSTEAVPIAVTCLLTLILQPMLGNDVRLLGRVASSFMGPVFFFVLAMFIIALGWMKTGLARRFALWMISKAGTSTNRVICVFVIGTGLISTIISDVPAAAIFMAIALGIFQKVGVKPGSNFGKAIMLGIPIGSLIGGVGTPAGSSINLLGLSTMAQGGVSPVPFLSWMVIGMPMVAIMLPIACVVLMKWYPPEFGSIGEMSDIQKERYHLGPISTQEKKVLLIMGAMLVCWIAGNWHPEIFDTFLVGITGAIFMFMPGMNLFTWKEAQDATGWDTLLMLGAVSSLGAASTSTGLAKWIVGSTMGGLHGMGLIPLLLIISAFTVAIHLVIPVNPAIIAAIVPPMIILGKDLGVNPAIYALPVIFTTSAAFLLPLDAVPLVTFSKGYYKMFDMFMPGLILSIAWIVVMTVLLRFLGPVLGLL
jgi:sodium-dependent dicarboxylate transporter 2/3/5